MRSEITFCFPSTEWMLIFYQLERRRFSLQTSWSIFIRLNWSTHCKIKCKSVTEKVLCLQKTNFFLTVGKHRFSGPPKPYDFRTKNVNILYKNHIISAGLYFVLFYQYSNRISLFQTQYSRKVMKSIPHDQNSNWLCLSYL